MKEFVCNVCDGIFETKGGLNSHIENYHQEGSKNFNCEFCEKFFTTARNLLIHINAQQEGQNKIKCDFCGKSFTLRGNLKSHIKFLHEGQKISNLIPVQNPSVHQDL